METLHEMFTLDDFGHRTLMGGVRLEIPYQLMSKYHQILKEGEDTFRISFETRLAFW